jgi:hypothetical protein
MRAWDIARDLISNRVSEKMLDTNAALLALPGVVDWQQRAYLQGAALRPVAPLPCQDHKWIFTWCLFNLHRAT